MNVMKTPRCVDLSVTSLCNYRCTYCSHFTSESEVDHELDTNAWLHFIDELGACTVIEVCFQGGEPFTRSDLMRLIRAVVENRMRFRILSNGTLITDETAGFLAATGRCDSVQISIDGARAETHDTFRGPGSFERAIAGIRHLLRYHVPVSVRVTIHKANVAELER